MTVSASALVVRKGILPGYRHAVANDADEHGNAHGDHHPDRGDPAGIVELFLLLNGHKPQQDMGHPKVAQSPRKGGHNAQAAERCFCAGGNVIALGQIQIAGQRAGVVDHRRQAAGLMDPEEYHGDQGDGHENGLDQIGEGNRHEAAHHRVADHHDGAYDHGGVVIHAEQAVEQRADGLEAGGGVGNEEHQNHHGGDAGKAVLFIPETAGEEVRTVMAPIRAEYRRRRRATISQFR